MNNLILLNEHILFDTIVDKLNTLTDMNLGTLVKLIEMSDFSKKLERLIYSIISNTIEYDLLPEEDKGMLNEFLWHFIKRLLYINKSQFVNHIINVIPKEVFNIYNPIYIFQNDPYFESHTIVNYIKLLNDQNINWNRIQEKMIFNLLAASNKNTIEYVTIILNAAIELKSIELINAVEVVCDKKNSEINKLINNTNNAIR